MFSITEARVSFPPAHALRRRPQLLCFAEIEVDGCLVIKDLKLIQGLARRFVAMPSRRTTAACPHCDSQAPLDARCCPQCGGPVDLAAVLDERPHRDVCFPTDPPTRALIERAVIDAYEAALAGASALPATA